MRWTVLTATVVSLTLLGCDEAEEGCSEPAGERLDLVPFDSTLPTPPEGVLHDGVFDAFGPGQVEFTTTAGERYGWVMHAENTVVPDLVGERVGLTVDRLGPQVGDQVAPIVHAQQRTGGGTLLLAGSRELTEPVAGWTVSAPRDTTTCSPYERDGGVGYRKPVTFARDGEEYRLFAGQRVSVDDLVLSVVEAESWIRVHPFDPCEPPGCERERIEWLIAPADRLPAPAEPDDAGE